MFASEPPPTRPASSILTPISPPIRIALASSARLRGSGSIGGRPKPPSTSSVAPVSVGRSARSASSTSRAAALVGTRTSTTAVATGATTFGRRPPSIVPTLTVTPCAGSFSANSFCT